MDSSLAFRNTFKIYFAHLFLYVRTEGRQLIISLLLDLVSYGPFIFFPSLHSPPRNHDELGPAFGEGNGFIELSETSIRCWEVVKGCIR